MSRAYSIGYTDGVKWDLDGFATIGDACAASGWAQSTADHLGYVVFARLLGVEHGTDAFDRAMRAYERGVLDAIAGGWNRGRPPQDGRRSP